MARQRDLSKRRTTDRQVRRALELAEDLGEGGGQGDMTGQCEDNWLRFGELLNNAQKAWDADRNRDALALAKAAQKAAKSAQACERTVSAPEWARY